MISLCLTKVLVKFVNQNSGIKMSECRKVRSYYIFSLLVIIVICASCQLKRVDGFIYEPSAEEMTIHEGKRLVPGENKLWGYQDSIGQWLIQPQYRYAASFSDGVAIVSNEPELSYDIINDRSELIGTINVADLNILSHFHEGYLIYKDTQKNCFGLLNKKGEKCFLANKAVRSISLPQNGLMIYSDGKGYGVLSVDGTYLTLPIYEKEEVLVMAEKMRIKNLSSKTQESQIAFKKTIQITPKERMDQALYWLFESAKLASSQPADSIFRQVILHYTECLRTAYEVKNLDFIKQAFSDDALIIVGKVIQSKEQPSIMSANQVEYNVRTKQQYLQQLAKVFALNKQLDLSFSRQKVVCHPTKPGFYGVTLKQGYRSDTYSDEGWLFLLWDFRNPENPQIHVRTWQPSMIDPQTPLPESNVFNFSDFTLG